jgi:hypothetical protein
VQVAVLSASGFEHPAPGLMITPCASMTWSVPGEGTVTTTLFASTSKPS